MDTRASPTRLANVRRYGMLAIVLLVAIVVVALVASLTRERIVANQHAWFVAHLDELIPPAAHDNDLFRDRIHVTAPDNLGDAPAAIYRARRNGRPVGAIIAATAPDGYGGPIDLLIAVDYTGSLLGVDVLHHSETPGIGDGFAANGSKWLHDLIGKSLDTTPPKRWTIRQDGGDFDRFTGASVTPRSILKAVRHALEYYALNRDTIFHAPAESH